MLSLAHIFKNNVVTLAFTAELLLCLGGRLALRALTKDLKFYDIFYLNFKRTLQEAGGS